MSNWIFLLKLWACSWGIQDSGMGAWSLIFESASNQKLRTQSWDSESDELLLDEQPMEIPSSPFSAKLEASTSFSSTWNAARCKRYLLPLHCQSCTENAIRMDQASGPNDRWKTTYVLKRSNLHSWVRVETPDWTTAKCTWDGYKTSEKASTTNIDNVWDAAISTKFTPWDKAKNERTARAIKSKLIMRNLSGTWGWLCGIDSNTTPIKKWWGSKEKNEFRVYYICWYYEYNTQTVKLVRLQKFRRFATSALPYRNYNASNGKSSRLWAKRPMVHQSIAKRDV